MFKYIGTYIMAIKQNPRNPITDDAVTHIFPIDAIYAVIFNISAIVTEVFNEVVTML